MAQIKKEENVTRMNDLPKDPITYSYQQFVYGNSNSGVIFAPYITNLFPPSPITGMPHYIKPFNLPKLKIRSRYTFVQNMKGNNNGKT